MSASSRKQSSEKRVVCIGECMVELAHLDGSTLQIAFGGDTSNTAIYLARLTRSSGVTVDYVTALGDDRYSDAMLAFWQEEGVGTSLITRLNGRLPGLYTIHTDDSGERSFTYWRGQAAARDMLREDRDRTLLSAVQGADLVYLSGISLSILDIEQRSALLPILDAVRGAGGRVAFDGNYRPAGWPDPEDARSWFDKLLERTDIALPTLDDERMLFGDTDAAAVAARLGERGVAEIVVKLGAGGCFLSTEDGAKTIATRSVDHVIDSTAAGDSFNAGYLASRLLGNTPDEAARLGHEVAGRVVCHRGAVIPEDAMRAEIGRCSASALHGEG
ncbi:MAG: sugar kinase [Geminicoccaceae bacterium]